MKLFGEFLVEKELINKETLMNMLVEQVRTMPSYLELSWRSKHISADNLLAILKLQSQKHIGFMEALRELGLWSTEIEGNIFAEASTLKIPLGQILVNNNIITAEALTHALDEFLSSMNAPSCHKNIMENREGEK